MEPDNTEAVIEPVSDVKKNKKFNPIPSLIVVVVILIISRLISSKNNSPAPTNPTSSSSTPFVEKPVVAKSSLVDVFNGQVSIEAGSFYFSPNIIRVRKNQKIKLTLNSVSMMHDLKIDDLKVSVPVTKSGESSTVEFTPEKTGEFEFYCSVGNHRSQGQVGKLIVTD